MTKSVIVIRGPIGSGKSTIARKLAERFKSSETRSAVIDLDLVWKMLEAWPPGPDWEETLSWARRAAVAIADSFFASGVSAVVLEGDFWNRFSREEFAEQFRTRVTPRYVTLNVSYKEALRRVQGEPSRGISREPAFLKGNNDGFQTCANSMDSEDFLLGTDGRQVAELVEEVWDRLKLGRKD